MCQTETPDSPKVKGSEVSHPTNTTGSVVSATVTKPAAVPPVAPMLPPVAPILPSVVPILPSVESLPVQHVKEITPPAKRGRGRPKRIASDKSPAAVIPPVTSRIAEVQLQKGNVPEHLTSSAPDTVGHSAEVTGVGGPMQQSTTGATANIPPATPMPTNPLNSQSAATPMPTNTGPVQQSNAEVAANVLSATPMLSQSAASSVPIHGKGRGRKTQSGREWPRRRGKKQVVMSPPVPAGSVGPDVKVNEQLEDKIVSPSGQVIPQSETVPSATAVHHPTAVSVSASNCGNDNLGVDVVLNAQLPLLPLPSVTTLSPTVPSDPSVQMQSKGQIGKSQVGAGTPRRRGKKQATMSPPVPVVLGLQSMDPTSNLPTSSDAVSGDKGTELSNLLENNVQESKCIIQDQASQSNQALKTLDESDDLAKQAVISPSCEDSTVNSQGILCISVSNF